MELEGKIWKSGKFWLVEVPAIEVMTQGYSREEALAMVVDAIEGLVGCYYPHESKASHRPSILQHHSFAVPPEF